MVPTLLRASRDFARAATSPPGGGCPVFRIGQPPPCDVGAPRSPVSNPASDRSTIAQLRQDLGSARAELAIALHALETSSERWLAVARQTLAARSMTAANDLAGLTPRQRQIMELVLDGQPSKNIAADLGVSQRTIENHRASIMRKMHSKSLPALTRCAIAATAR